MLTLGADEIRTQIRTQVDLVVVPVTVKDSKGKLVTGLTKEDFTIREDKKLQSITNFSIDPQPLSAAIVVDDGMNGNQLRRLYTVLALRLHNARSGVHLQRSHGCVSL